MTSIIRFTQFFQSHPFIDGTWTGVDLIIWTQVEAGVYLISACLMTYRPLLERLGHTSMIQKLSKHSNSSSRTTHNAKHIVDFTHNGYANRRIGLGRGGYAREESVSDIPLQNKDIGGKDKVASWSGVENDTAFDSRPMDLEQQIKASR